MIDELVSIDYLNPITFNFIGTCSELPETSDVVIIDRMPYVWGGSKWHELGDTSDTRHKKIRYSSNCKNCGAVLHSEVCEYCGTMNRED